MNTPATRSQMQSLLPLSPNGPPPTHYHDAYYVVEMPSGSILAMSAQDLVRRLGTFAERCPRHAPMPDVVALQARVETLEADLRRAGEDHLESNREILLLKDMCDKQAEQIKLPPELRRERLAQICVVVRLRLLEKGRLHGVSELGIDAAVACHAERLAAQQERDDLRAKLAVAGVK